MSDGNALDPGTVIGRRYVILAAEGRAGDCLHYRAEETGTSAVLAIAEYFPDRVAVRTPEGAVAPASAAAAFPAAAVHVVCNRLPVFHSRAFVVLN